MVIAGYRIPKGSNVRWEECGEEVRREKRRVTGWELETQIISTQVLPARSRGELAALLWNYYRQIHWRPTTDGLIGRVALQRRERYGHARAAAVLGLDITWDGAYEDVWQQSFAALKNNCYFSRRNRFNFGSKKKCKIDADLSAAFSEENCCPVQNIILRPILRLHLASGGLQFEKMSHIGS